MVDLGGRSDPVGVARDRFALHDEREVADVGVTLQLRLAQNDGIRANRAPVANLDRANLHDAILEQVGLERSVGVDSHIVTDEDEICLGEVSGVDEASMPNLRAKESHECGEHRGSDQWGYEQRDAEVVEDSGVCLDVPNPTTPKRLD